MEMLKIPIPAPTCSYPPAPPTSTNPYYTGPITAAPRQKCDYSSVNLAKEQQKNYFLSYMGVKGWQKVWHKNKR
jgi:hypothetical protein